MTGWSDKLLEVAKDLLLLSAELQVRLDELLQELLQVHQFRLNC